MGDFYAQAKNLLGKMNKQNSRYADATVTAERLPGQLREEFRKRQDPAMSKAIRSAEQRTLGGAIEGLNKYQHIVNPFARRDLAEKFQGSLSKTYTSLTDERQRRTGVINDYINLWSGTYGAMAKGEQIKASNLQQQYSGAMQMAGVEQSQSNWERSFARSGAKGSGSYKDSEVIATINRAKKEGLEWEEISNRLAQSGINVGEGSLADNELRRVHGYAPVGKKYKETERTPQQQHQDRYYNILKEIEDGNSKYELDDNGNIIEKTGRGSWKRNKDRLVISKK